MNTLPINVYNDNNYRYSFKGNVFKPSSVINAEKIEKQLDKISKADGDTKKLFAGLSALAGAVIAEFALFAKEHPEVKEFADNLTEELDIQDLDEIKNLFNKYIINEEAEKEDVKTEEEQEEHIDYSVLFEEKPERNKYLAITSKYFPNLSEKYENMLIKSLKEPENDDNKFTLDALENIFAVLSSDDGLKYRKRYFDALNEDYIDYLDGVCKNFISTIKNGDTPMQYLVMLANGSITPEDINKWSKADSLPLKQFMMIRSLPEKVILNIAKLEEQNPDIKLKAFKNMVSELYRDKDFAFKLDFKEGTSIKDKLIAVKLVHEAIYGPIYLKANRAAHQKFLQSDIQAEMVDNILKDRSMDAVYNLVKYINPSALKGIGVKPQDVRFLDKNDKIYQKIKKICTDEVMHMNFESPEVKALCDVLNDDTIFGDIITTRHGKLRFLTRIVMKDDVTKEYLLNKTKQKMETFKREVDSRLEFCNIFCYFHSLGQAPQFYLKDSRLGNYLKVTLNSEGSIHTIYEDVKKEIRDRELAAENTETKE